MFSLISLPVPSQQMTRFGSVLDECSTVRSARWCYRGKYRGRFVSRLTGRGHSQQIR
ncbi:hypothetical protein M2191_006483 [Bradyrhizobium japonicum]|nr:hypothetical protein [Bradyrhizobium japonicum]